MKKYIKYTLLSAFLFVGFTSCTDYLDVPVEAAKTDKDIFGDYYNFQGFVDQLYMYVPDPIYNSICTDNTWGGEALSSTTWCTGYNAARGLYKQFLSRGYFDCTDDYGPGIWKGWAAIRAANLGLTKLNLLEASDEEKAIIEGQLLFFRAYFHQEMLSGFGPIPYIKEVLTDNFKLPRYFEYGGFAGYQAVAQCAIEDFHRAAELLPVAWDEPTKNLGRCTAIAAKAYEARAALLAGSPLMSEFSGTNINDTRTPQVNTDFMEKAAVAAGEAIMMAKNNSTSYRLLEWSEYSDMFFTVDRSSPWSEETLWGRYIKDIGGGSFINNCLGRVHLPDNSVFGGNAINNTVTQNYVDLFEMKDGTLYDKTMDGQTYTDGAGKQRIKMWDDRDARFRRNIYVDRDTAGFDAKTILTLYTDDDTDKHEAGKTRKQNAVCPYFIHKYWPRGANKTDGGTVFANMRFMVPLMRLGEVYLIYAEAINEAYGNPNQKAGGCDITGLEAVNIIRNRADGQPATTATGGAHGSFRKMILNERAVELCFEGSYWFDLRRYKLAAAMHGEELQTLDFNKAWTNFSRRTVVNRVFEAKHYWLPFPSDLCKMYEGFPQNKGWE